jgi:hypothetical protein
MRNQRLTTRLHPALNPHPMRSLLRIRQQRLMRSRRRILRKRRLNLKSARGSSKLTATHFHLSVRGVRKPIDSCTGAGPNAWARAILFWLHAASGVTSAL